MKDINRSIAPKIQRLMSLFSAVAVLGPRQSGKSTLVKMLYPDWKYYDLERPDDYQLITSDPLGFFSRHSDKVIIDEAQQFPQIFSILRSVIDQDRHRTGRFLITGSSSPEIVKGLTESLAGRIARVELAPFKMSEFYQQPLSKFYDLITEKSPCLDAFGDLQTTISQQQMYQHWLQGGYPEVRIKSKVEPVFFNLWMDNYFSDFIGRDIRRLFPKINSHHFRQLIYALSYHSGSMINRSVVARSLEVTSVTVKEYLGIIHDTFIWRNLNSFEKNKLKRMQKMPKGFYRDSGLLHYLLKINEMDQLLIHPSAGSSFESFVIEEIIRGVEATMASNIDFNFYRTRDRSEVDLIIDTQYGFIPVEIKLGYKITKRQLQPIKSFLKETRSHYGILVNNADKIEWLSDNIIQIPANYL